MARGLRQYVLSGTDSAGFAKGPSGWIGNFHLLQRRTEKTDPVEGETGSDYLVSQAIMAEAGMKNFHAHGSHHDLCGIPAADET
ncbi:hypothetical protein [Sphingopyxis sp.]|uniref:hypothetical protein n=1 Tax=Sphingopyxis sp. TaxID=1908224 RepID=UPI003D152E8B